MMLKMGASTGQSVSSILVEQVQLLCVHNDFVYCTFCIDIIINTFLCFVCSYRSSHTLTSVDCHPQKLCVATGNTLGEIQLWYILFDILFYVIHLK